MAIYFHVKQTKVKENIKLYKKILIENIIKIQKLIRSKKNQLRYQLKSNFIKILLKITK